MKTQHIIFQLYLINTLLGTGTGEIYVTQSLDNEFSWTYSMTLCVHDRRVDTTCNDLSITLRKYTQILFNPIFYKNFTIHDLSITLRK